MADSYTNLLYHIVFSTKDRRPLITSEYEARLYDYIGGTIRGVGASHWTQWTEDHVHVYRGNRRSITLKFHFGMSSFSS